VREPAGLGGEVRRREKIRRVINQDRSYRGETVARRTVGCNLDDEVPMRVGRPRRLRGLVRKAGVDLDVDAQKMHDPGAVQRRREIDLALAGRVAVQVAVGLQRLLYALGRATIEPTNDCYEGL